ncbi:MAG: Ppx/GppA phosphatase family protein [Acidimicrobiales bacterium]|nr:Ppx/GppA phosphatase family protein [Acidimicrobiales bacterium]
MPSAAAPQSEHLAAIDIGTNSLHGVVARLTATDDGGGPRIEILERQKEMVRLGSSAGDMRELSADAIDRAVAALDRFRQVAAVHEAPITAVATSAAREAENREVLIQRAWDEAGVHVEVISGPEEARLIHLGVLQAVPVFDRRLLLCDIGGGSTELLVGQRGEVEAARSLKLGAIRLTKRFFDGERLHPSAVDTCRRFVRSTLAPFAHEVADLELDVAVGSSGTIGALAEMAAVRATGVRPRSLNNQVLRRADLDELMAELTKATSLAERAQLPGLDPSRADIILAGAVILEQVLHAFDVEELLISDYALREGVLLDAWRRRHGGSLHHLSELRRRSVLDLAQAMDDDPAHSAQVARLALDLFDATGPRHGLGDAEREILEAAALLCNVGLFLSHSQHHKHSYYVIRGTDRLSGFNDGEVELIALVARYHRKSEPKTKHPEFAALRDDEQHVVRCLAGILRIAIGLDRNHASRVGEVAIDDRGDRLVLSVAPSGPADISLELYEAGARKDLLESVLGAPLEVVDRAAAT